MLWASGGDGMKPDEFTLPCVLRTCGGMSDLGREVHAHVLRFGYGDHNIVVNVMIAIYVKCGLICCLFPLYTFRHISKHLASVNAAEAEDANEVEENDEPDEASVIGKANKTAQIDEAGNGETTGFRILEMNMDGMPGKVSSLWNESMFLG
ncbi:hypothetical protein Droror1_Dr00012828 [Drosera rotundifolia]